MSITNLTFVGAAQAPTVRNNTNPQAAASAAQPANGNAVPQDSVEIRSRPDSQAQAQAKPAVSATTDGAGTEAKKRTLYPGQRGYIPPPLSSQFDQSGKSVNFKT